MIYFYDLVFYSAQYPSARLFAVTKKHLLYVLSFVEWAVLKINFMFLLQKAETEGCPAMLMLDTFGQY